MDAATQKQIQAFLKAVTEEIERSRLKYPGDGENRYVAFTGEAGEAMQAWAKHLIYRSRESWDHLQLELTQAAAMAVRMAVEGDNTGWKPRELEGRLKHISECVPPALQDHPLDQLHRELDAYRSLGTPEEIKAGLAKRDELNRFLVGSMAIMELNSQATEEERRLRFEAEAKLEGMEERPDGSRIDQRLVLERDEAMASAGWLAQVVLDEHGGSATNAAWVARGKQIFRDAIQTVQRHRFLFEAAKQALEKQAYGCQDTCPECGEADRRHAHDCKLGDILTALWQASTTDQR